MYEIAKYNCIYVDEKEVNISEDTILIDEQTQKIHVDIMDIARFLGYDSHKGEFKIYTEDENKCWIECENETASFYLNSNKISSMSFIILFCKSWFFTQSTY